MKVCKTCLEQKTISEFYIHGGMKDRHLNHCKKCVKSRVHQHYQGHKENFKKYEKSRANDPKRVAARKAYIKTDKGISATRQAKSRWAKNNREKRNCHNKVVRALKTGFLVKKTCEKCGTDQKVEAHHDNYSKPLDVRWLCKTHHSEHHWHQVPF